MMNQPQITESKTIDYIVRAMRRFGATSMQVNGQTYNLFDDYDLSELTLKEPQLYDLEKYLRDTEYMWTDSRILWNAKNVGISPISKGFRQFYERHKALQQVSLPHGATNYHKES